jgi:small subunit ribosomal protein S11
MADQKTAEAAPKGGAAAAAPAPAPRKKAWKSVTFAKVHVQCSFNNTIVTLTDDRGDVLAWATAGGSGFRGTKKGTPFAAGVTASKVAKKAVEMGVKQVAVFIKGPGPGRETAVRSLGAAGLLVVSLKDVTPIPHNGCRPPKARRV